MRIGLKRVVSLLLCICLIAVASIAAYADTGNEVKAAKKIISVVYDDTGSMYQNGIDRVSYANYAMQSLIALLNPQDELYITFMSEQAAQKLDVSDVESNVAMVRNWGEEGPTLYSNVDIAFDAIKDVSADPSDQFWLFTFTDGEMYDSLEDMDNDIEIDKETLQRNFGQMAENVMDNGSSLNVVYLALGKNAMTLNSDKSKGFYTFASEDGESIRDSVNEIAGLISGRMDCENVKSSGGNKLTFSLPMPALSISVLSHNSEAEITSASGEGIDLTVERNIGLDTGTTPHATEDLKGNASSLIYKDAGNFKKSIPKGDYEIEFSGNVDPDNVLIQYEPAIGLMLTVTKDGVEVQDTGTLQSGDIVDFEITPVVSGTNEVIPDSDLPNSTTWKTEYQVDDETKKSSEGRQLKGVELELGDNMVIGTMYIPGFAPLVYELSFDIAEIVYHLGIKTVQPDDPEYKRSKLGEKGVDDSNEIRFYLTNDGEPMTKEDIDKGGIRLKTDDIGIGNRGWGFFKDSFTFRLNDDGSFTLIPKPTGPFGWGWFNGFISTGDYHITVYPDRDSSVTATADFRISGSWIETIVPIIIIIILLLIIAYIVQILIKPKFKNQVLIVETYQMKSSDTSRGIHKADQDIIIRLKTFGCHLFSLSKTCYVKFGDFKIVATKSDGPMITGDSIILATYSYTATTMNVAKSFRRVNNQMVETKNPDGSLRIANDVFLETISLCYKCYENDKNISRICTSANAITNS